jgi:S1-C subfamily serine protease
MIRPSGFSPLSGLGFEIRLSALFNRAFCAALVGLAASPLLAKPHPGSAAPTPSPAVTTPTQPPQSLSVSQEVKDIFDRNRRGVVKVHAQDEHSDIYGTGFFIDPTGTLYTANSVVGDAGNFSIDYKGKQYSARLIAADARSGVALLKVDLVSPALPIGKTDELEVATPVVTIGYPLDLPETPGFGMIAGFDHKYMGRYLSTRHLRVNLPTQRGEAGAPLLNLKGEVVGILVSSLENNSSCYALPIEAAEKIRSDVVRFGEVRDGWIGAAVGEAKESVEGSHTVVTDILGPVTASDGGMRVGDMLLRVGKIDVHDPEDVIDASFFITAGDSVPITVIRDGKKMTLTIEADFHPMSQRRGMIFSALPQGTLNRGIPLSLQPQSVPQ